MCGLKPRRRADLPLLTRRMSGHREQDPALGLAAQAGGKRHGAAQLEEAVRRRRHKHLQTSASSWAREDTDGLPRPVPTGTSWSAGTGSSTTAACRRSSPPRGLERGLRPVLRGPPTARRLWCHLALRSLSYPRGRRPKAHSLRGAGRALSSQRGPPQAPPWCGESPLPQIDESNTLESQAPVLEPRLGLGTPHTAIRPLRHHRQAHPARPRHPGRARQRRKGSGGQARRERAHPQDHARLLR